MEIELIAKCDKCGYKQIIKGFEKILKSNKNEKMGILYTNFLLVNEKSCFKCENDV